MKQTPEEFAAHVKANVAKHGFHITYVGAANVGEVSSPAFCYSTGIFETHGIPELIISSLPPGLSGEFMHSYVKRFATTSPVLGRRLPKHDKPFDFYLIPVEPNRLIDYVLATIKYYDSREFQYLQLIFPDPDMRFPHDDGYKYDQEILGDYSIIKMK